MKKLILTLFLASASLVSFAQSTVKTIRVTDATTVMTVNLPVGTLVIDVATKDLYIATAGVLSTFTITTALAEGTPLLLKVNGSVYSVIDEAVADGDDETNGTIVVSNSNAADGALVAIANTDFKVYVNGSLLATTAYSYSLGAITIPGNIYQYDQVSVVYNTIK